MRRMVAIQMGAAVLLAFLWAPFLHVHKAQHHENGPHGQGALPPHRNKIVIHPHLPVAPPAALGHDAQEADLSHANHDAEPLSIVALQAKYVSPLFPGLRVEGSVLLAPTLVLVTTAISDDPSAHDPPHLNLTIPRAPPA